MISFGKEDVFAKVRERMLEFDLKGRDITDSDVLRVMAEIPREEFVPNAYQSQAYADGPLPIGMGQTISQPYIVALMTQELRLKPDCQVLEIGTGSGYQTAILCGLAKKVYTIERFAELSEAAQATLGRLEIKNVEFYIGDGSCGWTGKQTFDRIIITATVPKIPQPIFDQLSDGGLIIAPIGPAGIQQLVVYEKKKDKLTKKVLCDVRFVRLIGKYGFEQ
jgi:protein-L-isoaspartate(D-aspartate) O-methyltransferase